MSRRYDPATRQRISFAKTGSAAFLGLTTIVLSPRQAKWQRGEAAAQRREQLSSSQRRRGEVATRRRGPLSPTKRQRGEVVTRQRKPLSSPKR